MGELLVNAFPVDFAPKRIRLPFVQCEGWKASTELRKERFGAFRTYRFEADDDSHPGDVDEAETELIRLVLLAGPEIPSDALSEEFDVGEFPRIAEILVENALSRFLESRGLAIKRTRFERLALQQVESAGPLVQFFSGISFRARRPFRAQPYSFTLSAQWVARATFAETLASDILREISPGLAVLYTPRDEPLPELADYENHYLGRVKEVGDSQHVIVGCRDNALRKMEVADLTLEASPEAIRRYELRTGSTHERTRIWRRLQQLSQVLTPEGRRNTAVLRHRLEAIRNLLGGRAKEQLILPIECFETGTVSIGLSPLRVEVSA